MGIHHDCSIGASRACVHAAGQIPQRRILHVHLFTRSPNAAIPYLFPPSNHPPATRVHMYCIYSYLPPQGPPPPAICTSSTYEHCTIP